MTLHLAFLVGSGDSNSGPQTCEAHPLLTELSLQTSWVHLEVSRTSLPALFFCLTCTAYTGELEGEEVRGGSDTWENLGTVYG